MEKRNPSQTQGNPGQGGTRAQGGGKGGARPSSSGEPNEGRGTEGPGSQDDRSRTTQEGYKYKGGRQGTGGVPNPDDVDDSESAGSFRGTANRPTGSDDDAFSEDQTRNPA